MDEIQNASIRIMLEYSLSGIEFMVHLRILLLSTNQSRMDLLLVQDIFFNISLMPSEVAPILKTMSSFFLIHVEQIKKILLVFSAFNSNIISI